MGMLILEVALSLAILMAAFFVIYLVTGSLLMAALLVFMVLAFRFIDSQNVF